MRNLVKENPDFNSIYLEYGEYAQPRAEDTVSELSELLFSELVKFGGRPSEADSRKDKKTLSLLNRLAQSMYEESPQRKFLIILDEFDEIHSEMYRFGPLAETFFSNLRTLSAKQNLAFMLVGGENMPFIMAAQGDQLNKYVREPVDYFSRSSEWDDFIALVTEKGRMPLKWHDSAFYRVFEYTNGHPYYTKLLCSSVFQNAVSDRDTDVTDYEVELAAMGLVQRLDTNAFAHFWKDGIAGDREEAEVISLKRCRLLVAVARVMRSKLPLTIENIGRESGAVGLLSADILPLISDFCRREIMLERADRYDFLVRLFGEWLAANGINRLIADRLGDELEASIKTAEEAAYVTSPEIVELVKKWPLYKGRRISSEDVRAWLDQVESYRDQRLLYKILTSLDVVGEEAVREKLRAAHSLVKQRTTPFTPANRSQRRFDLLVTYVDGPGKSGSQYASKYAEENLISATCVMPLNDFSSSAAEAEKRKIAHGIVIIDDIAATGSSLAGNLRDFMIRHREFAENRSIPVIVVVLYCTKEADEVIRSTISEIGYEKLEFRVCEYLTAENELFNRSDVWTDQNEKQQALEMARRIGQQIYKNNPLGYGGKALNIVFYDTCPNNTLPIIHSGSPSWTPLFQRISN